MTPNDKPKKTIDERLEAIAQSVELIAHMQAQGEREIQRLAHRERTAREALLSGIAAYLRALQQEPEEGEQQR